MLIEGCYNLIEFNTTLRIVSPLVYGLEVNFITGSC
jgi:hypothetical protein